MLLLSYFPLTHPHLVYYSFISIPLILQRVSGFLDLFVLSSYYIVVIIVILIVSSDHKCCQVMRSVVAFTTSPFFFFFAHTVMCKYNWNKAKMNIFVFMWVSGEDVNYGDDVVVIVFIVFFFAAAAVTEPFFIRHFLVMRTCTKWH